MLGQTNQLSFNTILQTLLQQYLRKTFSRTSISSGSSNSESDISDPSESSKSSSSANFFFRPPPWKDMYNLLFMNMSEQHLTQEDI